MTNLLDYAFNLKSQSGEDGIIREIFRRIGVKNSWCCEFGAWDGEHLSNTWTLINKARWSSVQIEMDVEKFNILEKRYLHREDVHCINCGVTKEMGLDKILSKTQIPKDFDLLVIDVDGNDYWLWKWMVEYQPRVVMIEYNSSMPHNLHFVQKYDFELHLSSSLLAISTLAKEKGYELIAGLGGNAVFVRKEEFSKFDIEDNSVKAMTNNAFQPILISDQCGRHFIIKVGIYGMTKNNPQQPYSRFTISGALPQKHVEEIYIQEDEDAKKIREIMRRGWPEEDPSTITPVRLQTFTDLGK